MRAFATEPVRSGDDSQNPPRSPAAPETPPPPLAEIVGAGAPSRAYSPIVLAGVARLVEFCGLAALGLVLHEAHVAPIWGRDASYFILIPTMALLAVTLLQASGLYTVAAFRTPILCGLRIFAAWSLVFVGALIALFFFKLDAKFSRLWLASWYVGGLPLLMCERFALAALVRRLSIAGRLERRTAIVGGGPLAVPVLKALSAQRDGELRVLGVFDDRDDDRSPDVVAGFPKLGTVDELVEFSRHARLDLIVFTLPVSAEERLLAMLRKLEVLPVDIRLAAYSNKLRFRPRAYSYLGDVPVFDLFDKPIGDWDVFVKSIFDRVVGAILLVLLAPVMALVALAVKLDSRGPTLFKQTRYGFNNEKIEVYKFRSMFADALDPMARRLVSRDDSRVTRVGRFIRKTSLDELPQLFNVVIKGNLSLVGPRPHAPQARAAERLYAEVVDGYFARHRVKPGITGWAQINGWRGETDTPEKIQKRVEHDLAYIENWSLLRDIYILALTPFALFRSENAY